MKTLLRTGTSYISRWDKNSLLLSLFLYLYYKEDIMRIDNLIKRLEWAQSMGITHIDISKSDTGDFHMITGQNADGEVKQIYPMSDEEKAQQKASKPVSDKPKKETDFVGSDDWRYSDREDDFGDLEDGFFGDDNGKMYESIQKIKEQFKRYL